MAVDVTERLGKQPLAGAFVVNRGFVKKRALGSAGAGVGGLIGGAINTAGTAIAAKTTRPSDTPSFSGLAYLAVTDDEVVLFKAKQGLRWSPGVGEEIARLPRSEIASAEFDGGYVSHLTISPRDAGAWRFSIQRVYKKSAAEIADVLQATRV